MSNTLSYSQGTYRVGDTALFACSSSSRSELLDQLRAIRRNVRSAFDPAPGATVYGAATSKHRLAIVSKSPEDFVAKLELAISRLTGRDSRLNLGQEIVYGLTTDYDHLRKTAFVFPGLGVPTQAMFQDLHGRFPAVRAWFDKIQASELAHFRQRIPILPEDEVINELDTPGDEEMRQFDSMQEMLLANVAVFKLFQSVGLAADSMVGHSHGEQALLLASGMVKSSAEMFYLLRRISRATIVSSGGPPLATLAVATTARFTADDLRRACGTSAVVALDNCPGQQVVCGPSEVIASVADAVRASGGLCFPMPGLSQPVHTPNFPVNERRLRKIYGEIGIGSARVPAYSCTSAEPFPSHASEIRELLVQQWLRPVRFRETVERLYEDGVRTFVELGPGGKVTGFVRDVLRSTDAIALAVHQEGRSTIHQLQLTLGKLFVRGHDLDLSTIVEGGRDANEEIVIETAGVRPQQSAGILETVLRHLARLLDVGESDETLDFRRGFFEMGLTSLGAVELAGRLSEECGVALADTAAFEFPSPESLAEYIERLLRPIAEPSPEPARSISLGSAQDDIAIIGMGLRLPGGANSPKQFWELLREGRDAIVEVPQGRWDGNDEWDEAVLSGGFLQEVDGFDAAFFGISPREAETLDPQQRLLLEVSWEALENAGINPQTLRQSRTGVFCGISSNDYAMRLSSAERLAINGYIGTGNAASVAVGRISYLLGLNGPCLAVDTACSSSLVAVHLACQSLLLQESDAAMAGGVNLLLSPETSLFLQYGQALSETGRCRTFDASADGYVRAEGCGVVVLKRLKDAVADGDRICAVIRASAVNHDGRSSGLTVPSGTAQEAVLRTALQAACVDPLDVDYVEAHGTGTPLGDPIEVRALSAVYCAQRSPDRPLRLGSVKTNVGHLEAAAGITALVKVVLQLQERTFVPSLHFSSPNPRIPWQESPLEVCVGLAPWETPRRIAGVSSFGMSGTNAHMLVQSAPNPGEPVEAAAPTQSQLLMLSAQSEPALRHLETAYANLQGLIKRSGLQAFCYTANVGRAQFRYRRAVVGRDVEAMQSALRTAPSHEHRKKRPKIAFLFSGQGSQTLNMGRQFYAVNQRFRQVLQECDEILRRERDIPLLKILFESPEEILQTRVLQPALFAIEYALAQTWKSWGIDPDLVVGHSVGEYAAACHAGVMPLRSALLLVSARAICMESICDCGGMLAVRASEEQVRRLIDIDDRALSFAAVNGPQSVVLSGADGAIRRAQEVLNSNGVACMSLKVSHAFHSSQMDPALVEFQKMAVGMVYEAPRIPWISTVSGCLAGSEVLSTEYWTRQIRQTVRFADAMKALAEKGVEAFLEIGPRPVLIGLGQEMIGEPQQLWLASLHPPRDEDEQMLSSLGRLYESGFDIDLKGFYGTERHTAVELPTYPFERTRYWMTAPSGLSQVAHKVEAKLSGSLLGELMDLPGGRDLRFEAEVVVTESLQDDYRVFGRAALPVSAGLAIALAAARVRESGAVLLEEFLPGFAFRLDGLARLSVQTIITPEDESCSRLEVHGRNTFDWEQKASCCVRTVTSLSTVRETLHEKQDLPGIDVAQFYDSSARMGFAYGDNLQVLERLAAGNGRAVGVIARRADSRDPTQWPLLEGCFQVLGAALYLREGVDASGYYSPVRIGAVRLEHELPNRFFAVASCAELTSGMVGRLSLFEFDSKEWFGEIAEVLYVPVDTQASETRDVSVPGWKTCEEGEQPRLIREHLQAILCGILRRSKVSTVEVDEPFQRFGMDSLMATEFSNALQREFGIRLSVGHFIGESSLKTLSDEVMVQLREITTAEETVDWVEGVL